MQWPISSYLIGKPSIMLSYCAVVQYFNETDPACSKLNLVWFREVAAPNSHIYDILSTVTQCNMIYDVCEPCNIQLYQVECNNRGISHDICVFYGTAVLKAKNTIGNFRLCKNGVQDASTCPTSSLRNVKPNLGNGTPCAFNVHC